MRVFDMKNQVIKFQCGLLQNEKDILDLFSSLIKTQQLRNYDDSIKIYARKLIHKNKLTTRGEIVNEYKIREGGENNSRAISKFTKNEFKEASQKRKK